MKKISSLWLFLVVLVLMSFLPVSAQSGEPYFRVPQELPGDFEGKWYGIHVPTSLVPREAYVGFYRGEGFPNQPIINSWGYKAKPIEEIKDLLPETWYHICTHPEDWGPVRINETAFIPLDQWPGEHQRIRKQATEKNRGKARINEKGHLVNYENGFPFPGSTKAEEIAWNLVMAQNFGDMTFAHFYVAIVDRKGHTRYIVADNNYMAWVGRLRGKQVPRWEPNPNNYEWFNALAYKAPYDFRGTISVSHRYNDSEKQDDMWMYLPALRRTRRMSTAQRWDKLPGGYDLTYDAIAGFQGKVTNYRWKFLGKKKLLCGRTGLDQLQQIKDKPVGGTVDQLYQRLDALVVEYYPNITSSVSK